jgi:hypothetical protein
MGMLYKCPLYPFYTLSKHDKYSNTCRAATDMRGAEPQPSYPSTLKQLHRHNISSTACFHLYPVHVPHCIAICSKHALVISPPRSQQHKGRWPQKQPHAFVPAIASACKCVCMYVCFRIWYSCLSNFCSRILPRNPH